MTPDPTSVDSDAVQQAVEPFVWIVFDPPGEEFDYRTFSTEREAQDHADDCNDRSGLPHGDVREVKPIPLYREVPALRQRLADAERERDELKRAVHRAKVYRDDAEKIVGEQARTISDCRDQLAAATDENRRLREALERCLKVGEALGAGAKRDQMSATNGGREIRRISRSALSPIEAGKEERE